MQEPLGSEPESDSDFEYESNNRGKRGRKRGPKSKLVSMFIHLKVSQDIPDYL